MAASQLPLVIRRRVPSFVQHQPSPDVATEFRIEALSCDADPSIIWGLACHPNEPDSRAPAILSQGQLNRVVGTYRPERRPDDALGRHGFHKSWQNLTGMEPDPPTPGIGQGSVDDPCRDARVVVLLVGENLSGGHGSMLAHPGAARLAPSDGTDDHRDQTGIIPSPGTPNTGG